MRGRVWSQTARRRDLPQVVGAAFVAGSDVIGQE
jgi:hypothetical protein